MRMCFLQIIEEPVHEIGIIFAINCSSFLKMVGVNNIARISETCRHEFVRSQNQLGVLRNWFAQRKPLFSLLLRIWRVVVNPYYETAHKLFWTAVEERQLLFRSCHIRLRLKSIMSNIGTHIADKFLIHKWLFNIETKEPAAMSITRALSISDGPTPCRTFDQSFQM